MADDNLIIKGTFDATTAQVKALQDELKAAEAEARAVGDTAAELKAQLQQLDVLGPRGSGQAIQSEAAAAERLNTLKKEGERLDAESLAQLQRQTDALLEQAAVRERLQRPQGSLIVAEGSQYQPYGTRAQTAGGQAAAEEAAYRRAALAQEIDQGQLAALRASAIATPYQSPGKSFDQLAGQQAAAEQQRITEELHAQQQVRAEIAAQEERDRQVAAEQLAIYQAQAAAAKEVRNQLAYQSGAAAAGAGLRVSADTQEKLAAVPTGVKAQDWSAADQAAVHYNTTLGSYDALAAKSSLSTEALQTNLTRLGVADAEASNQLRKHGALTTEFLTALARGETTVSEFGYQIGATIGKFAGWAGAAALTYGALGSVVEFGKGALDTASTVQQLTRTIDNVNPSQAANAIQQLSSETNVNMKEAGDAVFAFSRTFHSVDEAVGAARLGLAAYKLDNVAIADSVRASTAISTQYGGGLANLTTVYNELSAAQREYNARISDMIPLLQKSSGAVHNAGGDLTQLIQLGTYATRITQLSGAQVGTALYRGASNFLNPATTKGTADIATLQQLGVSFTGNYTQTLIDAIRRAPALSEVQRSQLSNAVFGPQYGGRLSAIFNPQSTSTFEQIAGGGRRGINPDATRGSLDTELQRQLGTAGERLKSFVNELQRLGAAFAETGAISLFTGAVGVTVSVLDQFRKVVDVFNGLPGPLKEAATAALAFRTAMLFFSRTRFGATTPGITSIPGFRPSDATLARGTLSIGTRQALTAVEADISATQQQLLQVGSRQAIAGQRYAALQREVVATEMEDVAALEAANVAGLKVLELKREQTRLETLAQEQDELRAGLSAQLVGLTATSRNRRFTDPQVLALQEDVGGGTLAASNAASRERSAAESDVVRRVNEATAVTEADTAARVANADATRAGTIAEEESTAAQAGRFTRLATGFAGVLTAIDPMLVALVAAPLVIGQVTKNINDMDAAAKQFHQAGNQQVTDVAGLAAKAAALSSAERAAIRAAGETSPGSTINNPLGTRLGAVASDETNLVNLFKQRLKGIDNLPGLVDSAGGRSQIPELTGQLQAAGAKLAEKSLAGFPGLIRQAQKALADSLQREYANAIAKAPSVSSSPLANFTSLDTKSLGDLVKYSDDYSKAFGTDTNGGIKNAITAYAVLADKLGKGGFNDADLAKLSAAQQNLTSTLSASVSKLVADAQSAPSSGQADADLSKAYTAIEKERKAIQDALNAVIAQDKGNAAAIRRAKAVADILTQQINTTLDSIVQQQNAQLQSQSTLAQSEVTGSSPESDIARQQTALNYLKQELANAQGHGDRKAAIDLQGQVNDAQNQLAKAQQDNARAILAAQGQVAEASITGISPQDDIARARQAVIDATAALNFDRANGAGTAAILTDQAAVYNAERSLNQAIQSRDQQIAQDAKALIDAQTSFAESQTLDPIKQAREQLAGDIKALATIKPSDYTDQQQYQAAILAQKTKINNDRTSLNDKIVQQDLSTLKFELSTQKIGDQQYINSLQQILKTKQLTLAERQQIQTEIYNTQQGLSQSLDLNVGKIKLPSVYEIKRAIGLGQRGVDPGGGGVQVNHTANVQVNVYGPKGAGAVGRVLDDHLGTSVRSAMRAKGVLRTG